MVLPYYSRPEVIEAIFKSAEDREIAIKYEFGFGKRPDAFFNEQDIVECVKQGATSFHYSEELWENPLDISSSLSKQQLDDLKKGWDLIIDIDTPYFPYSKIATKLVIDALLFHGVKSASVKFSGNHGFHIGVPFEAFPLQVHGKETRLLFPEGARKVALYLREMIRPHLQKALQDETTEIIARNVKKSMDEIIENGELDPFSIVDIDTILISSRHLCRMPYSINEKSGLVSLPIEIEEIMGFERDMAKTDVINVEKMFLERDVDQGEATKLFVAAFDKSAEILEKEMYKEVSESAKKYEFEELTEAIPELFFPPSIKKILEGMKDGKKRALFILLTFLANAGWSRDKAYGRIKEWNKANPEPLKESYIQGQFSYYPQLKGKLPPNYNNDMYYQSLGILSDKEKQSKIKNPLNFSRRQYLLQKNSNKPKKEKPTEKVQEQNHKNSKPSLKEDLSEEKQ